MGRVVEENAALLDKVTLLENRIARLKDDLELNNDLAGMPGMGGGSGGAAEKAKLEVRQSYSRW